MLGKGGGGVTLSNLQLWSRSADGIFSVGLSDAVTAGHMTACL